MKWLKAIGTLIITLGLVYALDHKFGDIPPVGKFLDPFHGFWANAESKSVAKEKNLDIPGLKGKVQVVFDDVLVPHIFAENNYDLYFAQGYVTAMHRLWQMEFQTHAAAGRISEIVGERALELDRYSRRMGMVYGAEKATKNMLADPVSREVVQAYSAGINAYIDELSPEDYPLEYKLLGYAPEPWSPMKCGLLLQQLSNTLTGGSDDLYMTNILTAFGKDVVKDLFPDYPFVEDPIIPPGTPLDFTPVAIPKAPNGFLANATDTIVTPAPDPEIGSNNWAVHGSKSASGYPILANDPHLNLTLPSIWYQIQLVSPDVNVYGASLPGAPSVISGFNKEVAWGLTNVGADVMDFYQLRFKDNTRTQYWHDNQWKAVRRRVEEIKVKGKASVFDTVLYTHHGPVVYKDGEKPFDTQAPTEHAMRWAAHEAENELLAFVKLNRARNYQDYVEALSYYATPAQNFIYADAHNDIAIWPNGKFPLKWKNQGKFILDGTSSAYDWQGRIPHAHNPHVKNPPRGFVSSANQFSADTTYPYYLNWEFAPSERGRRINQRLAGMQKATPDSLRLLQSDNFNLYAEAVLPKLLSYVYQDKLTAKQKTALQTLSQWNYRNDPQEIGPTIFTSWWNNLNNAVWRDEFGNRQTPEMRYPSRDRTIHLILNEPQSRWIDNTNTSPKETLADLVNLSFKKTVDTLYARYGDMNESWQWAPYKSTDIMHLARIPALSRRDIMNGGGSSIVNATTERNGPSWRIVVALGPQVKGYGVYPGGQSGNPGSFYYDNMIETWRKGELNELVFMQKPEETSSRIIARWNLKE
ncbi:penicillin acylase family protein [Rhodocytophaga rosea]|uniref:Penicillin acylase family protein n=1 Tax=Rhodocytophaga rosea TaxID=2704465 RepID=A0A6C0GLN4_9BACT|nr:penicillin acylase family protein [Rhodocytophaga rosea]QHT68935.1 penicillin acylase family protein [Rhodocytophaga rosea]